MCSRIFFRLCARMSMLACVTLGWSVADWHAGWAYAGAAAHSVPLGQTAQTGAADTSGTDHSISSGQGHRDPDAIDQAHPRHTAGAPTLQRSRPGEFYGAVYGGYTIAHGIDLQGTGLGSFANLGTIELKNSGMYGGKLGYFFPGRGNWAGIEVEAFRTTPNVKGTATGATIFGIPLPLAGVQGSAAQLSVTTVALNAIARAKFLCRSEARAAASSSPDEETPPWCVLQPYAGVGLGVFFADLSSAFGNIESPVLGLNVLAGVRYYLTRRIALFGEYKYNRASFRIDNVEGTRAGIDGVYSVSHVAAGLSLHW